jgi:hypothetical protein
VLIQGSDSFRDVGLVSLVFMFVYGRTCAPMTFVNRPAMRPNAHAMHPSAMRTYQRCPRSNPAMHISLQTKTRDAPLRPARCTHRGLNPLTPPSREFFDFFRGRF